MELLQLKYFCEAARCENFSKAAAKFGIPPAGVSQSIKRLESELGVKLFDRRANSLSLSAEGRAFYEKAAHALDLIDEGKNKAKEANGAGQIKILASSIRRIVMQAVEKFHCAYPDVEIIMSCSSDENITDYDVVISNTDLPAAFGSREELIIERMLIAMHKNHPLAAKETLSTEDIKEESFITMGKSSGLSRFCEKIYSYLGFSPNISIRCDDPYYVRKCVELSLGIAIVPEIAWRGLYSPDVVFRPFCEMHRKNFVYVNKKHDGSKNIMAFAELLLEEGKTEIRADL